MSIKNNIKNTKNTKNKVNSKVNTTPFSSNEITLIKDFSKLKYNGAPEFIYEGGDGFQGVKFYLKLGESINANGGAMNYMSSDIIVNTTMSGGFLANLGRGISRILSGSTAFYNNFSNKTDTTKFISFAGINPGNVGCFYIPPGKKLKLVSNTYICSTPNLRISGKMQLGGFVLGYGLFYVTVEAGETAGLIWAASYGDIIKIELKGGESIKIDNGVLLGLDDDIWFESTTIGGLTSTFLSGEGLVTLIRNDYEVTKDIFLKGRSDSAYIEYISNIVNKNK